MSIAEFWNFVKEGERCEYRYPAREEWRPGIVIKNGGPYFWMVRDEETGEIVRSIYAEHVREVSQ